MICRTTDISKCFIESLGVRDNESRLYQLDRCKSYANNVDPDQMPRSAESGLGLHCLLISLIWDARHKWVKCPHT